MNDFLMHADWISRPPSLKDYFDNVRNYPLLAALFLGAYGAFVSAAGLWSGIPFVVLLVLGSLAVLSIMQTAMLMSCSLRHIVGKPGAPSTATSRWIFGLFVGACVVVVCVGLLEITKQLITRAPH